MVHVAPEGYAHKCPKCGSGHMDLVENGKILICLDCGYET